MPKQIKKGEFNPELLKNDINVKSLDNYNKIEWLYNNTEYVKEFIEHLKGVENEKDKDFKDKIYKTLDDSNKNIIIGRRRFENLMPIENIKDDVYIYLITDNKYTKLYISIDKTFPFFWYKYNTKKEFIDKFDYLCLLYDEPNYNLSFQGKMRGFIGTEKMLSVDFDGVAKLLIENRFTDGLVWGSVWKDYPFRNLYLTNNISKHEHMIYTEQAMKQLTNEMMHLNTRTRFSKSIVTLENHNGAFIISVQYKKTPVPQIQEVNNILEKKYNLDIPIDVIQTIASLPFTTHLELLYSEPISAHNIILATFITNDSDMYKEILPILIKLSPLCHNEEKEIADFFIEKIQANLQFYSLLKEQEVDDYVFEQIYDLMNNVEKFKEIKDNIYNLLSKKLCSIKPSDAKIKDYLSRLMFNSLNRARFRLQDELNANI